MLAVAHCRCSRSNRSALNVSGLRTESTDVAEKSPLLTGGVAAGFGTMLCQRHESPPMSTLAPDSQQYQTLQPSRLLKSCCMLCTNGLQTKLPFL